MIFFSLLACHSIIQADRIHKTPGPETKDLSISFPLVSLVPRIPQGQRRWMLDHRQLASQSRNSELQELESFIKGSKQNYWRETLFSSCLTGSKTALYSRWRFYHYLPRLFTIQTSLKIQSGEEGQLAPLFVRRVETQQLHRLCPPAGFCLHWHKFVREIRVRFSFGAIQLKR